MKVTAPISSVSPHPLAALRYLPLAGDVNYKIQHAGKPLPTSKPHLRVKQKIKGKAASPRAFLYALSATPHIFFIHFPPFFDADLLRSTSALRLPGTKTQLKVCLGPKNHPRGVSAPSWTFPALPLEIWKRDFKIHPRVFGFEEAQPVRAHSWDATCHWERQGL